MPNYFYTDASGQRQGPINDQHLRVLAAQRKILPTTPLETEGGHRGLAGQIPGLFPVPQPGPAGPVPPPPTPSQLFCTNCGTACSEQAVACMSCGAKPTGHKRFCRQCGVGLNLEQVVCIKCGASVATTRLPDAKRVVQSVIASSMIKGAKNLVLGGIAVAVVVGLVWLTANFWPSSHPLRKAKPGDWARYDVTVSGDGNLAPRGGQTMKMTSVIEVLSNDGKKVKLRTTTTNTERYGPPEQKHEWEVDLSKPEEEIVLSMLKGTPFGDAIKNVKFERGKKTTKETEWAAGKEYNCIVVTTVLTGIVTRDDGETAELTSTSKDWTSKTAPFTGTVRSDVNLMLIAKRETVNIFMTTSLAAFGHDPEIAKKAAELAMKEANAAKAKECANRLSQICLALLNYENQRNSFPPLYSVDSNGRPLHSWRVLILPFLDELHLYNQIRLDEPWNSPHNSQFHRRVPNVYQCPDNKDIKDTANCTYSVIKDDRHCFPEGGRTSRSSIDYISTHDGASNTIAIVEVKKPFCWMDPSADLTLEEFSSGINTRQSRAGSFHPGGINVVAFSCEIHFLGDSTNSQTLRALATRNGGESVSFP